MMEMKLTNPLKLNDMLLMPFLLHKIFSIRNDLGMAEQLT